MSWNANKNPDKIRARLDRARKKLESEGVRVASTAMGLGKASARPNNHIRRVGARPSTGSFRTRGFSSSPSGGSYGDLSPVDVDDGVSGRYNLGSYRYLKTQKGLASTGGYQGSSARPSSSSSAMIRRQSGKSVARSVGNGHQSFLSSTVGSERMSSLRRSLSQSDRDMERDLARG